MIINEAKWELVEIICKENNDLLLEVMEKNNVHNTCSLTEDMLREFCREKGILENRRNEKCKKN